jgi:beta-fructofuranosidase
MFGWLQEQRSKEEQIAAGWSGVMSLPRVLSIEGNRLKLDFAPEVRSLRKESVSLNDITITQTQVIEGLDSAELELQITFTKSTAQRSGVVLHHGDEKVQIYLDWSAKEIVVESGSHTYRGEFANVTDKIDIHLFADHSVLELIANREVAMSCRIYPKQVGGSVELYSRGGESKVSLEAWNLSSIWP